MEILYYLSYGVLAFFATIIHPFFFAFHLSEFLIKFPSLRTILKSVWEPRWQLLLTMVLICVSVYFFTIISYMWFSDSFSGRCENLYMCLFEVFDRCFKADGALGGWLEENKPKSASKIN